MTSPSIQTATILVNPAARRAARFDADRACRYVEKHGIATRLAIPQSAEAFVWAACESAERGDDMLFVVGGDGSLRLAAGALAGSETALAALPGGTTGVWVREAGLPRRFRTAMDAHLGGQRVRMDVGRAGEEPFLLMAGIGWDGEIVSRVNKRLKQRFGPAAYVARGVRDLPSLRTRLLRWRTPEGDFEMQAGVFIVSNSRLYGGLVEFTPDALVDDGALDLCIAGPHGPGAGTRMAAKLVLGKLDGDPDLVRARVTEAAVETPGLVVQLDGDPILRTPARFTVSHRALWMSVPAGDLPPIFSPRQE